MSNFIRNILASTFIVSILATPAYSYPGKKIFHGVASFYADKFNGRKTASGERFDNSKLTCAHRTLPFGTKILVENPDTGSRCEVIVNDRGPYAHNRVVDLSKAAAKRLGITGLGKVVCYAGKHVVDAIDVEPKKAVVVAKKDSGRVIASSQTASTVDKAVANVPVLADKAAVAEGGKVTAD